MENISTVAITNELFTVGKNFIFVVFYKGSIQNNPADGTYLEATPTEIEFIEVFLGIINLGREADAEVT